VNWSWPWVVIDALPGLAFLILGQVAWARRPGNRIGPLMVATGFAWFVGTAAVAIDPVASAIFSAFQGYYDPLLAWLVLAYPTGRLIDRRSRLFVGTFFGLLLARTVFRFAVFEPFQSYDFGNPADIERYIANQTIRVDGELAFRVAMTVLALVLLGLVVARLRRETNLGRRVAAPILVGGLAVATGIVVELIATLIDARSVEVRAFLYDATNYITSLSGAIVAVGFVVGLRQSRIARGNVADLVLELGASPGPAQLRDVLARALRDPSLEVVYAVPERGIFVDAAGRIVALPEGRPDRAVTRLERDGQAIAALIHEPALAEQVELVRSVAAATRLALENERLQAEVRAQLEEVRASRARIVDAGDAERRRVERDLHDGAQQRLVTLALALQMSQARAGGAADPELVALLSKAGRELDLALGELRELARGIHPTLLAESGLGAAIESLADRSPVPVSVTVGEGRFDAGIEATAYFVVAEALTNVAKYAAASKVCVDVERRDDSLHVRIRDDGAGGADASRGSGLRGLADRVAAVGGVLTVESPAGGGTTITAEIPCA